MRAFHRVSLPENDSAAQRREEKARPGKSRDGVWKKVETKVDLDCLGEAERTWAHIFKQKKKKAQQCLRSGSPKGEDEIQILMHKLHYGISPLQGKGAGLSNPTSVNH